MTRVLSYVVIAFALLVTLNCLSAHGRGPAPCKPVPKKRPDYCQTVRLANECEKDSQCSPYKCCEQPCGNRICNKPKPEEPAPDETNQCPAAPKVLPDKCAYTDYMPNCKVNSDCSSGLCCPNECGVPMCSTPPGKPGQCPPPPSGATICPVSCESDADCPDTDKCCQMGCQRKCEKAQFSSSCPLVDTSINCFVKDPDLCNTDSDCSSGQSCCPTACRGTKCV